MCLFEVNDYNVCFNYMRVVAYIKLRWIFISQFNKICPNEIAILSNIVAISLSTDKSANDNNVLGNFLVAIGSIILTIAAQQQNIAASQNIDGSIKWARTLRLQGVHTEGPFRLNLTYISYNIQIATFIRGALTKSGTAYLW